MSTRRLVARVLAGLVAVGAPAGAAPFQSASNYVLAADATLPSELWLHAHSIRIEGTAEDDLFLFGDGRGGPRAAVQVSGDVGNDLWAAGSDVVVDGTVADHARLAGFRTVAVEGEIGSTLAAVGETVRLAESAEVDGDAYLMGGDLIVEGHVHGNAHVRGRRVTLAGTFDRDVRVAAEDLTIMPGTRIGGDLLYTLGRDLVLDPKVEVAGSVRRTPPAPGAAASPFRPGLWAELGFYIGALLVGVLFLKLFPAYGAGAADRIRRSFWKCLLVGFIGFCLVPMASLLFLVTVVGIPLSLMLMLSYVLLLYLSKVTAGFAVGRALLRRRDPGAGPVFRFLAVGLLVLYALANLPFPVSLIVWFAIVFSGLGGMILGIAEQRPASQPAAAGPPPPPAAAEGRRAPPGWKEW